jgi:hypothetical protein
MQDFKKLQVWQKAHALTLGIDRASKRIRGSQYALPEIRSSEQRLRFRQTSLKAEGKKTTGTLGGFSVSL